MLISMGILSLLCLFLGLFPNVLYALLPYPVEFVPYTVTRVFSITQLFIFSFLGFWLLRKWLGGHPTYVLDTDWFVRIPGGLFIKFCKVPLITFGSYLDKQIMKFTATFIVRMRSPNIEARLTPMAIGLGVLMSLLLLAIFLFLKI